MEHLRYADIKYMAVITQRMGELDISLYWYKFFTLYVK